MTPLQVLYEDNHLSRSTSSLGHRPGRRHGRRHARRPGRPLPQGEVRQARQRVRRRRAPAGPAGERRRDLRPHGQGARAPERALPRRAACASATGPWWMRDRPRTRVLSCTGSRATPSRTSRTPRRGRCREHGRRASRTGSPLSLEHYVLLEIDLETGRHHQIRAQLAAIGCHIKGDLKYGARRSNPGGGIHLHAREVSFEHPVRKTPLTIVARRRPPGPAVMRTRP